MKSAVATTDMRYDADRAVLVGWLPPALRIAKARQGLRTEPADRRVDLRQPLVTDEQDDRSVVQ